MSKDNNYISKYEDTSKNNAYVKMESTWEPISNFYEISPKEESNGEIRSLLSKYKDASKNSDYVELESTWEPVSKDAAVFEVSSKSGTTDEYKNYITDVEGLPVIKPSIQLTAIFDDISKNINKLKDTSVGIRGQFGDSFNNLVDQYEECAKSLKTFQQESFDRATKCMDKYISNRNKILKLKGIKTLPNKEGMHYSKDGQYIVVHQKTATSSQELDQNTLKQIEELEKENKTLLSKIDQLGEISLSEGPYLAYSAASTMDFYEEAVPYESQMIMQDGPIAGVASGNLIIKPQTRYGVVCKPEVGYLVQSRYGVVWPGENYKIGIKGKLKNTPDGFYVTDERQLQSAGSTKGKATMERYVTPLNKSENAKVISEMRKITPTNDAVEMKSYIEPLNKNGVAEASSEIKPLIQNEVWREIKPIK